jgi:hypothetical protein
MKKFKKVSIVIVLAFALVFSFASPNFVNAATAPNLGVAIGYSVFGNAGITETVGQLSHLWGNAGGNGFGHASLIASQVDGSIDAGANVPVVGAISTAYGNLASEAQTGVIDLATSPTVVPGVYNVGATAFSSTLTLNGAGVYIFRSTSSIAQTAGGTMVLTNGATACNVFWQIPTSMTFAAVGSIEGTIITNTGLISFVPGVSLKGRAWAATQVTMNNNQITEPTCVIPPVSGSHTGTINVVKTVINDSGRTNVVSDFPLFVNGTPVVSGVTNTFSTTGGNVYSVTETSNSNYTRTFSGDCDINGQMNLNNGDNKFCIVTNNDIGVPLAVVPPLIDLVKTANPLSLPSGAGSVVYTYTLRNIGTVPVTNITIVGDTCSPINLVSGDTDADSKLDLNEVWVHTCSTTLSATHTNIAVATGWANGISTTDIASATVVVGLPIVPPLIHVVKKPSAFIVPVNGAVTYTYTVTNPGTAPLNNVGITDDKCTGLPNRVIGHPGDLNKNNLLENNETWTFICQSNLTQTTTNIGTATGYANGLMARDFSLVTVVVSAPKLPKTGFPPEEKNSLWNVIVPAGVLIALVSFYLARKKEVI